MFTELAYGNPHVWAIMACLAVAYGALIFMPGAEFARTHLGTSPRLSYLYPPVFAALAFVVALDLAASRRAEADLSLLVGPARLHRAGGDLGRQPHLPAWDHPSEVFLVGWLILQQLGKLYGLAALLRGLPWSERREPGSLRGRSCAHARVTGRRSSRHPNAVIGSARVLRPS